MQIEQAFIDLMTTRSSALLRTAYLLTGDRAEAEDLLQEALLAVYRKRHRVVEVAALEGYVRTTLVRAHISRRRRRSTTEIPRGELPERPQTSGEPVTFGDLWPVVAKLPARQRAVVVLIYYEDLPEPEVARLLGCSVGAVKSHRARALGALRRHLASGVALSGGELR